MNLTALIPLLKLFEESRSVSPKRPAFFPKEERGVTPPSKQLPDLGLLHYFK